jgi:hypothetical protein
MLGLPSATNSVSSNGLFASAIAMARSRPPEPRSRTTSFIRWAASGLIDDQLRVAQQTSRFVIADLTHANNGAYWEAGFAEGLGRPVIYTCRQTEWDELDERGRRKVHFDASHLVTIIWDPTHLDDASTRLTATIRATLPGEAKMTD